MEPIFIAGASGFIGKNLTRSLVEKGYPVRCLARSATSAEKCKALGAEPFEGDVNEPASLEGAMDGISTVINLVGIIEERGDLTFEKVHIKGTVSLVGEARRAGVTHFIQQSALGANLNSKARYHSTKALAEQEVSGSGLSFSIFRPSLVIGKGDGFTRKLTGIIKSPAPFIPVPGAGRALFQPIYVDDLVRCFIKVIENPENGKVYEIGGPEHLTYTAIVETLAKTIGVKKKIVHIPMGLASFGVKLLENTPLRQATSEQLMLLDTDNICEKDSVKNFFGFEPVTYRDALARLISSPEPDSSSGQRPS